MDESTEAKLSKAAHLNAALLARVDELGRSNSKFLIKNEQIRAKVAQLKAEHVLDMENLESSQAEIERIREKYAVLSDKYEGEHAEHEHKLAIAREAGDILRPGILMGSANEKGVAMVEAMKLLEKLK